MKTRIEGFKLLQNVKTLNDIKELILPENDVEFLTNLFIEKQNKSCLTQPIELIDAVKESSTTDRR